MNLFNVGRESKLNWSVTTTTSTGQIFQPSSSNCVCVCVWVRIGDFFSRRSYYYVALFLMLLHAVGYLLTVTVAVQMERLDDRISSRLLIVDQIRRSS